MSLEEYFCDGPKIRVPPCSFPPLAGAHVGRAAVVISRFLPRRLGSSNAKKEENGTSDSAYSENKNESVHNM